MSKKIQSEKGFSYISVLIGLVVILIISLSIVSSVHTNNQASTKTSQNIISSEIINSFMDLGENKIENLPSNPTQEQLEAVYVDLKKEVTSFNEKNNRYSLDVFLNCETFCETTKSTSYKSTDYSYHPKQVEIAVVVKSKSEFTAVDYRLAVFNQ